MIRFIWNNWWRNKGRFTLLLIGALIVSTGLSYLVGITQANNGTIVDELQNRWSASYDIVVRPPGTRSVTEEMNLLEPNYQSGLSGGITLEQYNKIKAMDEVEVAAPIAMMGFINNDLELGNVKVDENGIYRLTITEETNTGAGVERDTGHLYFTVGVWEPDGLGKEYGTLRYTGALPLNYGSQVMIAGIDPEAEDALVGLEGAMVENKNSDYFDESDTAYTYEVDTGIVETNIPVILSNQEFVDSKRTYTISKLDMPFSPEEQEKTMEMVKENGAEAYLDQQTGVEVEKYTFTTGETHQKMVEELLNPSALDGLTIETNQMIPFKASPVEYRPVTSPFSERWPFAYEVEPYLIPDNLQLAETEAYRPINMFGEEFSDWPRVNLTILGVFDPGKLDISKDPLTELPMETYFPSKSTLVMDREGLPVNPPQELKPLNNPYGFLTKPPMMLTTLDAAAEVLGEEPISSIRLKVKGVNSLEESSQEILQNVAAQIEKETGLITDITLGSSPQPALTHIPGLKGRDALGWVEQPWIKIGSSFTIFKEAKIGLSGVVASVILVAIVYVFSSNLIMMFTRKKEFAVLLSVGWRPNQLSRLLFIEAIILGSFVSIVSWMILGYFYMTSEVSTSLWRFILIGLFGMIIYVLGTIIPAVLVRSIKPYEAMKSGEITAVGRRLLPSSSIWSMSLNYFIGKWKRSILSIISIALPTSLFMIFLFITFRLKGVLYATWLGQYVAMEVSSMHYIAMGVALMIAILTTTEIIWQNVSERQPEIALLKAIGWHNRRIRLLVLYEGIFSGVFAGVLGLLVAILVIWRMYQEFPVEHLSFFLVCMLIPVVTGMIGALFPAAKAVRTEPYQALGGSADSSKRTEKQFKVVLGAVSVMLFVGLITILSQAVPELKMATQNQIDPSTIEGTSGETTKSVIKMVAEEEKEEEKEVEETVDQLGIQKESAWKNIEMGQSIEDSESIFRYEVAQSPEGVKAKDSANKIVTIKGTIDYFAGEGRHLVKLYGYQMVDAEGQIYESVDLTILEKENWNRVYLTQPGKVVFLHSFEVPKESKSLNLRVNHAFQPGTIMVEVE